MASYKTQDIRNMVLLGHVGCGKTTLLEKLLTHSGTISAAGVIEKGTTLCDFDPQEKELGHSLYSAVCSMDVEGAHVNFLDTPGYPDFLGRALSVVAAADSAAVVVNAQNGVELVTERVMESLQERRLCRMIIVNKIDSADVDFSHILSSLQETFGTECLPINLPAKDSDQVVDCFFEPGYELQAAFSTVQEAHDAIIDQVIELDEQLMEVYLEQGEAISPEQLHDPFEKALREGHLIPVCFVSAASGAGIPELIKVIARLMPNPLEGNPPPFFKGEGASSKPVAVSPDAKGHVIAHVFKVTVDPYVGKLGIFRIHQGTLHSSAQLFIGDARKPFKVSHLLKVQGKKTKEIGVAIPGDICAVSKIEDIQFDSVLHDSHEEDHYHLKSIDFPPPVYGIAIEPKRHGDEQRISEALHKMAAEDPGLSIVHRAAINETVIFGASELHLRVVLERMNQQFHADVVTHPPAIAYRETITQSAEGHHRHKKQTGGAGQFGEVYLKISPQPRGHGFTFISEVVGGAIPGSLIMAVEKGVRQVIESGAIAGFAMQDIEVVVYDGKTHSVDSKEVAFVAAGRKAFIEAVQKAAPILLEPVVSLKITTPADAVGDITGDLSSSRAIITGSDAKSRNRFQIKAKIPLSELENYQSKLKSMTGGEGVFTMEFSHYEAVPPKLQQTLVSQFKVQSDGD